MVMYDARVRDRFWSKVAILEDAAACWLWQAARRPRGYGAFNVGRVDGKKRTRLASRVAWELSTGEPVPAGLHVCHRCDNHPCVNPSHLWLGTDADNIHDAMAKGRFRPGVTIGEKQHDAKLTDGLVRSLRAARADGARLATLADKFGISIGTVWNVANRRTWKHVA